MSDQNSMPAIFETLKSAGYSCLRCGKCCARPAGDNSVFLMPDETDAIRNFLILNNIKIHGRDVSSSFTVPLFPDFYSDGENPVFDAKIISDNLSLIRNQISDSGVIFTFGSMLKRTENGTCIFLDPETNKCQIYPVRPLLCQTYPFFIDFNEFDTENPDNADVIECLCDGFESVSETEDSVCSEMAELLVRRAGLEKIDYDKTKKQIQADQILTSGVGFGLAKEDLKKGFLRFIVCDSHGAVEKKVLVTDFYLKTNDTNKTAKTSKTGKTGGTDEKSI